MTQQDRTVQGAAPRGQGDNLRVDGAALWRDLMDSARFGATPQGGVGRNAGA